MAQISEFSSEINFDWPEEFLNYFRQTKELQDQFLAPSEISRFREEMFVCDCPVQEPEPEPEPFMQQVRVKMYNADTGERLYFGRQAQNYVGEYVSEGQDRYIISDESKLKLIKDGFWLEDGNWYIDYQEKKTTLPDPENTVYKKLSPEKGKQFYV